MFFFHPKLFARIAAGGVFLIGILVWLGWAFDITAFKSVLPSWPNQSPLSAPAFLLAATALWCLTMAKPAPRTGQGGAISMWVSQFCSAAVMLIGSWRLANYFLGLNLSFEMLGFHEEVLAGKLPTHMAHATALAFVLIGSALFFAGRKQNATWFQIPVFTCGLISCLGLTRYLYGGEPLFPLSQMSVISSVCFLLLGFGVLCARADSGFMALVLSNSVGGITMRRLLPAAVVIPFVIGWLRLQGQKVGWFGTEAGLGLFALSNVVLFTGLIWATARVLHGLDVKQKQAELGSSRLAAIVAFSDDAIIGKDLSGRITSWNIGAEKVFGYTADEMVGTSILRLIPADRQQEEVHILGKISQGESVKHFETERLTKDGRLIQVSVTASPIKDGNGKIIGVSKVARDITATKRAEAALRESEVRLRLVLQAARIGDWELNPASREVSCSALHFQIFGYTEPFPAWNVERFLSHLHPDDRERVRSTVRSSLAAQEKLSFECRIIRCDQVERWVAVQGQFFQNLGGQPLRMLGILEDITERKIAELTLQQSQADFKDLFDNAPAGYHEVDAEGRIIRINATELKLLDYSIEELLGQPVWTISADEALSRQAVFEKLQGNIPSQAFERSFKRKDGTTFPVLIEDRLTKASDGRITGIRSVIKDITKRKLADEALQQSRAVLEAALASMTDAVVISDNKGNFIEVNDAFATFHRFKSKTECAKTFAEYPGILEVFLPDGKLAPVDMWAVPRALRGETATNAEYIIRRKDSGATWVGSYSFSPIRDKKGVIVGSVVVGRDITDLKRAEATLREHQEQLRLYAEHSPAAIAMFDRDMKYLVASHRWMEVYNLGEQLIIGRSHYEVFPEIPQRWKDIHMRCLAGAIEKCDEDIFTRGDGTTDWIRWEIMPWRQADGSVGGIIVFSEDITARKRAEEALRESVERLRNVTDNARVGLVMVDRERRYTFANSTYIEILRLPSPEIIGQRIADVLGPLYEDQVRFRLDDAFAGERVAYELRKPGPEGDYYYAVKYEPTKLNGVVSFVVVVITDITEHKRLELAVQESEERFRTMANSMSQLAWIAKADGFIFWYNQRWYEYTGTTPKEMEGWGWQSVHDPEMLPIVMKNWQAAISAGSSFEMEFPLRGADGRFRTFLTRGLPLKDSAGRVIQWFGTNTDVDELKQAEEKVRQLNAELERRVIERTTQLEAANKELEAFSYSVSHDLRAPLRAINGFAGMVLGEYGPQLPAEAKRYLDRIRNGGLQMGQLIDDLLTFSRLSRQGLKRQLVDMAELVRNILDDLAPQREGRQMQIKLEHLPSCQCDRALMKQVWINLVSNAIKYTRDRAPAVIEIGCNSNGGDNVYYVSDNGAGFDMKYADKLFGVFQRLHGSDEFEGTGVGLAIVQRIINRHDGRVWAEAEEGKGATFRFTIREDNKL